MENAVEIKGLGKKFRIPWKPEGGLFAYLPRHILPKKRFKEFWALKDINLRIPRGSMLGIIGRNGSGKSTLLKIISGILEPTRGEIKTSGRVAALLELGAGFHEELSGMENIFLSGAILGFTRNEIMRKLPAIIDFSELHEFMYTPIKHYSSGMQARLGFAIAINMDPEVLLVDEVISVGDREFQSKCISKIAEFRSHGKTILLVTHEIDVANFVCDELVWLEGGQVKISGAASRVSHEYRTRFLGSRLSKLLLYGSSDSEEENKTKALRNVRLLDKNGEEKNTFSHADSLSIEIELDTGKKILKRPCIHIFIIRHDNLVATDIRSSDWGYTPELLKEKTRLLVHLKPLLLLQNKYDISILIYDRDHTDTVYDRSLRRNHFEVTIEDPHIRPGIVAQLPCSWEIEQED